MDDFQNLLDRITINPEIFGGKPLIRNLRFTVADVLGYLSAGMTEEELLIQFSFLQKEDIRAALLYAAQKVDHTVIKVTLHAA